MERSQDLFDQIVQEVELDARLPNPDDEIRLRLAKLRNDDTSLNDLNKVLIPLLIYIFDKTSFFFYMLF